MVQRITAVFALLMILTPLAVASQSDPLTLLMATSFEHNGSGDASVYALDTASGHIETIISLDTFHAMFSLSPNGRYIAYVAWRGQNTAENDISYYMMDVRTRTTLKVADNGAVYGTMTQSLYAPVWSPDSSKLAVANYDSDSRQALITVVDLASGAAHAIPILNNLSQGPLWSPDNTQLIFSTDMAHGILGNVFIVPADGSEPPHRLMNGVEDSLADYQLAWFPDSRHVLVYSYSGGWYRVDTQTGEREPLAIDSREFFPSLHFLDSDTLLIEVSNQVQAIAVESGAVEFELPPYATRSPDGTKIFSITNDANTRTLEIVDFNTNAVLAHFDISTGGSSGIAQSLWSPDGSQVIFGVPLSMNGGADARIYVVNADGRESPRLVIEMAGGDFLGWAQP